MRAAARTWATAWRAAWANRRGFTTQVTLMVVNDAVWLGFWFLVFRRVSDLRGWRFDDVLILFAVLTSAAGLALGALHNAVRVGRLVLDGELDAVLTLPVSPLPHLLLRRIETLFIGDLVFGLGLFLALGNPTPTRLAVFVVVVLASALVLTGFLIAVGSTVFFVRRAEAGEMGFHAVLLFSSYPIDVFGGVGRALLLVVVPAGFVSSIPARLINDFQPIWAVALVGAAACFVTLGTTVFHLGLRRHTSGSLWV